MVTLYADDDDRDEMTAEELLETYLQNLENLVEHSDIWEQMLLYEDGIRYILPNACRIPGKTPKHYSS